jgi:hypothetical protein
VERERGRRLQAGAVEKGVSQQRPRPVQARLHGLFAEVEAFGRLGRVKPFDFAQHEDSPIGIRQGINLSLEQLRLPVLLRLAPAGARARALRGRQSASAT